METMNIEIVNPKARKLLNNLADLNLIAIKPQISFDQLLGNLRSKEASVPSLEEITEEVEMVRQARYDKQS
jgi:predicted CoA-binding protein